MNRVINFEKISNLPLVEGVAAVNRLLLPNNLRSDRDLRKAAAALRADILLVYTFDTDIYDGSNASPVDVVTLGFLPHREARVVSTASAVLVDTRNGYLYGTTEATAEAKRRANTWTNRSAVDKTRQQVETQAFTQLIDEFASTWHGVVNQYAYRSAPLREAVAIEPERSAAPGERYETAAR